MINGEKQWTVLVNYSSLCSSTRKDFSIKETAVLSQNLENKGNDFIPFKEYHSKVAAEIRTEKMGLVR